ncbi:MAG TPA: exo-alpha-sialidase [Spirochaetes bacterium]|nr:exo-alpha-sialidase [Spirochaetota bacterium]
MTSSSGFGRVKFWFAVFLVVFIDIFITLLCVMAVSSLWLDVNKFLVKASGLDWNWVAVILVATVLLLLYYGVQLFRLRRALIEPRAIKTGLIGRIMALPVLLVWSAMTLALFMEAGDAVLLSQVEYHWFLLGPWLFLALGGVFGYGAYASFKKADAGRKGRILKTVLAALCLALAVGVLISGGAGKGEDERAPVREQVFSEQVLFDAVADKQYITFRIPGIVVTPKGVVIAYCEAREGYSDWAKIDVYMKRSTDGGDTWEERSLLYAGGKTDTVNNPVMIAENGSETVHFLYNTNYRRAFYRKSADAGATWSAAVEITGVFEKFKHSYPWKVIAFGPGHGIQLRNGRLIAPVWLSPGGGGDGHHPHHVSTVYSDDGGRTWRTGRMVVGLKGPVIGEPVAVELSDGSVMLNMRNEIYDMDRVYRAVTVSRDGTKGWTTPALDTSLPDSICFGSIHRYDGKTILFSNAAGVLKTDHRLTFFDFRGPREPMVIRASLDDGKTWPFSRVYAPREGGYGDITVHKGTIYALYEQGWEKRNKYRTKYLKLARFNLPWVRNDR